MKQASWSDDAIIAALTGNEKSRAQVFERLFGGAGWRGEVLRYVRQWGGSTQDGEEVFLDALGDFDQNIRDGKYRGETTLRGYFISIARNHWRKKWQKIQNRRKAEENYRQREHPRGQAEPASQAEILDWYERADARELIFQTLSRYGKNCRRIFELTLLDYSLAEIAVELNLKNAEQAKKAKNRCILHGRAFLREHPEWKKFFKK